LATSIATIAPAWQCFCRACSEPQLSISEFDQKAGGWSEANGPSPIYPKKPEPANVTIDELERDPHGVFRRYRRQFPFINRADGTAPVLRNSDVQQLFTDPRTRQSEKEFFELRGIQGGTLFDLFKYSMVTSNGSDHRRRRSAFSTAFAFRAMTDLRL
jgi:cytochrome P450